MKKFIMFFAAAVFCITGCATAQNDKRAAFAPPPEGFYDGGITQAMDSQEREFRQASEKAFALSAVQRAQDELTLSFKSDLLFDKNSAVIKPGAYSSGELSRVAQILNRYPFTRIRVECYTDSTGRESANQTLSERRAGAMKNALITQNVEPSRIIALGLGQATPVAGNETEAGRQLNRRVAIVITWQQPPGPPAAAAQPQQQPSQNPPPAEYYYGYPPPVVYGPSAMFYGPPWWWPYYPPVFYGGVYYGGYYHGGYDGSHGHYHGGHR